MCVFYCCIRCWVRLAPLVPYSDKSFIDCLLVRSWLVRGKTELEVSSFCEPSFFLLFLNPSTQGNPEISWSLDLGHLWPSQLAAHTLFQCECVSLNFAGRLWLSVFGLQQNVRHCLRAAKRAFALTLHVQHREARRDYDELD